MSTSTTSTAASTTATSAGTTTITVTLYTTSTCGRCKVLARRLEKMGLAPTQVVLDREYAEAKDTVMETFGINAVPLTIIEGLFDHPVYFTDISPDITIGIKNRLNAMGDTTNEAAVLDNATWLPEGVDFRDLSKLTFDAAGTPQH